MAEKDTPKFVNVEVLVRRTGFYGNTLRGVGSKFRFTGDKLPSWVVLADKAKDEKPVKAKPMNGDTKPEDAQKAVKDKAAEASGASLA